MRPLGSVRCAPGVGLPRRGAGGGSSTNRVVPFREPLLTWVTVMSLLSLMTGSFARGGHGPPGGAPAPYSGSGNAGAVLQATADAGGPHSGSARAPLGNIRDRAASVPGGAKKDG